MKPRLKLDSRGWYIFWTKYWHNDGRVLDLWIGPFPSAEEAYAAR